MECRHSCDPGLILDNDANDPDIAKCQTLLVALKLVLEIKTFIKYFGVYFHVRKLHFCILSGEGYYL